MFRYITSILLCLQLAIRQGIAQPELSYYNVLDLSLSREAVDQLLLSGDSLYGKKQYSAALQFYELAKAKGYHLGYSKACIEAALNIAVTQAQLGAYNKGIDVIEEVLPLCSEHNGTTAFLSELYNRIAVHYSNMGMHTETVAAYRKAVSAAERYPESRTKPELIYINIAVDHGVMGMTEKALGYLRKVDSLLVKKPDAQLRARSYWAYAFIYDKTEEYERSKVYLNALIPLADSIQDHVTRFLAYWKLADRAMRQGDVVAMERYLDQIQDTAELEPMIRNRKHSMAGYLYMYKKNYAQAIAEHQKELELVKQSRLLPNILIAHANLAHAYAAIGDYKLAYQHERQSKLLKDSFNKEEQVKNIAIAEARYSSVHKDMELARKELYIDRQSNALTIRTIGVIVSLFAALLFLVLYLMVRRSYKHKQMLKDEKMQLVLKEKELHEIKALMEGEEQERNRIARDIHDGLMIQFSAVKMNLSAALNKNEQVKPYLVQLDRAIASLRSTAHNLMPDTLLEGGLAEAVYYFCENIKEFVAFEVTFNLLNDVPRFEEKFELAVYRIVQELIQNIVKHARAEEAFIQISYRDGLLNITIEDDGVGMANIQKDAKDGWGLKSIKNRMPALNGTMEIAGEQDAGTSIILEFVVADMLRVAEDGQG